MRRKKAQAAMEFLMTYGWAILVVLVVIGALAYFGVLSPQKLLPDRCNMPPGMTCNDYQIDGTSELLTLDIGNGLGKTINITAFTVGSSDDSVTCVDALPVDLPKITNGNKDIIVSGVCTGLPDKGEKQRLNFEITYKFAGSNLAHSLSGDVFVAVQ